MVLAERLKSLRLYRRLSQGDIEKRTGLLRCYISRVENGHSIPVIETLEKMARAMDIPLYALFYDGEEPPKRAPKPKPLPGGWGSSGRDARVLAKFREFLSRTNDADINFLLFIAEKMVQKKKAQERSGKNLSMKGRISN
jgi:transcriptional regulator with XRE-family HTH domain